MGESEAHDGAVSEIPPALYARMLPFLHESVIVVDEAWAIVANLSAPNGLLGWGDPTGIHTLAYMHPDDVLRFVDTGAGLQATDPGWSGSATVRLQRSDETYGTYEITLHNRTDDPVIQGMVISTRELPDPGPPPPELAPTSLVTSLADTLPTGVVLFIDAGTPLYVNDAACELLDTTREAVFGTGLQGLLPEADEMAVHRILGELSRTPGRRSLTVAVGPEGEAQRRLSVTLVSQTGSELVADGSERVLLVMAIIEDVTHRLEREEQLEHRANRDALTGLRNRAWLLDHLNDRLRAGADLTLVYLDLVGFKAVNDRLGHGAGDVVLAEIARGVAAAVAGVAEAARVGGDEFVVVQEKVADGDRAALVARVRGAVDGVPAAIDVGVTASVGAARSLPDDQPWDLLERADAAMYADKRGGRA